MKNKIYKDVWIDQFDQIVFCNSVKELQKIVGKKAKKIYENRGEITYHVGYAIGNRWFIRYTSVERKEN